MIFRQLLNEPISAASYLIGCVQTGECAVVDPGLPPETYVLAAADKGLQITAVVETHFHADYFSTGRPLAAMTGATIFAPSRDDIENAITGASVHYPHVRVRDGDRIRVGNIVLQAIHTPGHTPEHMSYAVIDTPRSDRPWMVLTGDCLFVNDVGRTDLVNLPLTGPVVMYDSIQRLLALPDDCEVFPAHYGGSACGSKQMSGKVSSTIGFERRFNWMLQARSKEEFIALSGDASREAVEAVLRHRNTNRGVLPLPDEILRLAPESGDGFAPMVEALAPERAHELTRRGAVMVDLRTQTAFAAGHPAGAVNVTFNRNNMVKRIQALIPTDEALVFISDVPLVARQAAQMLAQAGYTVAGYVNVPAARWGQSGLPVEQLPIADLEALHRYATEGDAVIVDVREPFEWEKGVIPNGKADVRLISLGDIRKRLHELPCDRTLVFTCESGTRASAVASLLKRMGYQQVVNIAPEGMSDYARRYPTVRPSFS